MIQAIFYAFLQFSSFAQPQSKCPLFFKHEFEFVLKINARIKLAIRHRILLGSKFPPPLKKLPLSHQLVKFLKAATQRVFMSFNYFHFLISNLTSELKLMPSITTKQIRISKIV
jgi:hypothetical protein